MFVFILVFVCLLYDDHTMMLVVKLKYTTTLAERISERNEKKYYVGSKVCKRMRMWKKYKEQIANIPKIKLNVSSFLLKVCMN